MRSFVSTAFRYAIWLGVATILTAIAVGRMHGPTPVSRVVGRVHHLNFPMSNRIGPEQTLRFLDARTGDVSTIHLPAGDAIDRPTCSPWRDERGQAQIVGRWRGQVGDGPDVVPKEVGLARFTFPGGEPLDRIATDVLPIGAPCWYPGRRARVLFAAGDGGLYHFAFEREGPAGTTLGRGDTEPQPIVWKMAPPGEEERSVVMADPVWPDDRELGGRLIVSMSLQVQSPDGPRHEPPRLWWLQLDRDGTAIEAAGLLTDYGSEPNRAEVSERCPRIGRASDGRLILAYLCRQVGETDYRLAVAPVGISPQGIPLADARPESASTIAGSCALTPPAFSSDGRCLYVLPAHPAAALVRRVATPVGPAPRPKMALSAIENPAR